MSCFADRPSARYKYGQDATQLRWIATRHTDEVLNLDADALSRSPGWPSRNRRAVRLDAGGGCQVEEVEDAHFQCGHQARGVLLAGGT